MDEPNVIPINETCTRFELDWDQVRLWLETFVVDLFIYAEIVHPDGTSDFIEDVWQRKGNFNAIWRLVGSRMTNVSMDQDSFRAYFEDGTFIRCSNGHHGEIARILWKNDAETPYPLVLNDDYWDELRAFNLSRKNRK